MLPSRQPQKAEPKLPPFGFRPDCYTMADLKPHIPLLFRVNFYPSATYFNPDRNSEYAFVAGAHGNFLNSPKAPWVANGASGKPTYGDVITYKSGKKVPSHYISTSASLSFALYWANVTVLKWKKRTNVSVVIIDARQVMDRAYTAYECLLNITESDKEYINGLKGNEYENKHFKFVKYANSMQEVFVADYIPASAVLGVVPWETLQAQLPPWYLKEYGDPGFAKVPAFMRIENEEDGCKIRRTFYEIRRHFSNVSSGPKDEVTRLQAAKTAFALLEDFISTTPEDAFTNDSDSKDVKPPIKSSSSAKTSTSPITPLALLAYLTHHILTFPVAPWPRDIFRISRNIPKAEFVYPGSEADLRSIQELVRRKVGEKAEMGRLVGRLVGKVSELCDVGIGALAMSRRHFITTQIQKIMEQRLYCFEDSRAELTQTGETIASHLKHLTRVAHVKRSEHDFLDGLKKFERELVLLDLEKDERGNVLLPPPLQNLRCTHPTFLFPMSIPVLRASYKRRSGGQRQGQSAGVKRNATLENMGDDVTTKSLEGSWPPKRGRGAR